MHRLGCFVLISLASAVAAGPREQTSAAAWLAVCAGSEKVAGTVQGSYEGGDGAEKKVMVTSSPPAGCAAVRLDADASTIVWTRLIPRSMALRLDAGFLLQGSDEPGVTSEVVPLDDPPAQPGGDDPPATPDATPRALPRSMWIWRGQSWQSDSSALLAHLVDWGVRIVYITLETTAEGTVSSAGRLRAFLREAAEQRVDVWVVFGDPRAVLPAERASFERRARAVEAFNRAGSPALAGIQYDIEPYLVPGYSLNEERWNDAYVSTIELLRRASTLPLEIAVPFWWLDARTRGERVMDRLSGAIDSVAVMDYRTDPEQIRQLARPWLEWGALRRRAVRIALEAGRLADEPRHHYRRAESGTLWRIDVGDASALVLLREPKPNPSGRAFAFVRRSWSDASRITFFGRTDRLRMLLPELERRFSVYPSFAGIALHDVGPPSR
jgi:hypothetical protein